MQSNSFLDYILCRVWAAIFNLGPWLKLMTVASAAETVVRVSSTATPGRTTTLPIVRMPAEEVSFLLLLLLLYVCLTALYCLRLFVKTKEENNLKLDTHYHASNVSTFSFLSYYLGVQLSNVSCRNEDTNSTVDDIFCHAKMKPRSLQRSCNDFECPPT